MLRYAILFFVLALIAGVFGLTGMAGDLAWIAKAFLIVFAVLFVASVILGRGRLGRPSL